VLADALKHKLDGLDATAELPATALMHTAAAKVNAIAAALNNMCKLANEAMEAQKDNSPVLKNSPSAVSTQALHKPRPTTLPQPTLPAIQVAQNNRNERTRCLVWALELKHKLCE
jgi:hypothetical protein